MSIKGNQKKKKKKEKTKAFEKNSQVRNLLLGEKKSEINKVSAECISSLEGAIKRILGQWKE